MYRSINENQLLRADIADLLQDYTSIQPDIDDKNIKAAALIAQNIDIKRVIGESNLDRIKGSEDEDLDENSKALLELVIPAWCYFTYSRFLLLFQGNLTDSGWTVEEGAANRNEAKSVAKEIKGVAETFMQDVIEFLQNENPNTKVSDEKLTPRIRVFGGCENRASN